MKIVYTHVRQYTTEEYFPYIGGLDTVNLNPRGGTTLAMQQIEPWYFDTLEPGTFFELSIGKAKCSVKDNYCKKTGRDLALERMKPRRVTVLDVIYGIVILKDEKDNSVYHMVKNEKSTRVYLDQYVEEE